MLEEQAEQQTDSHRIGRMAAAETVQTAGVAVHDAHHAFQGRLMRRTQTADKRFDDAAGREIAQSHRDSKAREDEQYRFPVAVLIDDDAEQDAVQRYPCSGAAHRPHERVEPVRGMAVNPKQYIGIEF